MGRCTCLACGCHNPADCDEKYCQKHIIEFSKKGKKDQGEDSEFDTRGVYQEDC